MAKILRNIDQIIDTQGNELSIANPVEVPQQLESFRNRFINGNMQVHQRGNIIVVAIVACLRIVNMFVKMVQHYIQIMM